MAENKNIELIRGDPKVAIRKLRQCRMPYSPDYHDSHRNIYYFYCRHAQTHA